MSDFATRQWVDRIEAEAMDWKNLRGTVLGLCVAARKLLERAEAAEVRAEAAEARIAELEAEQ